MIVKKNKNSTLTFSKVAREFLESILDESKNDQSLSILVMPCYKLERTTEERNSLCYAEVFRVERLKRGMNFKTTLYKYYISFSDYKGRLLPESLIPAGDIKIFGLTDPELLKILEELGLKGYPTLPMGFSVLYDDSYRILDLEGGYDSKKTNY